MNVLIAGGAGFLGSNLARRLLHDKHTVTVVDNFSTGRKQNLKELEDTFPNTLTVIDHDIVIPLPVFHKNFDVIANMASPASPPAYQKMPLETLHVNSAGTENLLKLALDMKARFIQSSTSEVYGDPMVHPQPEKYWGNVNSYGARSMYDEGKRFAEALIWVYRNTYNVNTGIIRIFNTYGPNRRLGEDDR
jgi:nucleoside-diphosphate-sugar epimerase